MNTLIAGASYGGSAWQCGLNYGLLVLVIWPNLADERRAWLVLLISFTLLQIGLWLVLPVRGISLIWCALGGYNAWRFAQRPGFSWVPFLPVFSLAASLGLLIYYALVFPPITTLAHGLALILGYGLARPLRRIDA